MDCKASEEDVLRGVFHKYPLVPNNFGDLDEVDIAAEGCTKAFQLDLEQVDWC